MKRRTEDGDQQCRNRLTPERYRVLRQKGTERPFPGRYVFMRRTEVTCASCGGHLGYVFDDAPAGCAPYCISSLFLELDPAGITRDDDPAAA